MQRLVWQRKIRTKVKLRKNQLLRNQRMLCHALPWARPSLHAAAVAGGYTFIKMARRILSLQLGEIVSLTLGLC